MIRVQLDLDEELARMARVAEAEAAEAMRRIGERVATVARQSHDFQNRTGNLEASIAVGDVTGSLAAGTLSVEVVATTDYAEYVEKKMPFLEPAAEQVAPEIEQELENAFARAAEHAL